MRTAISIVSGLRAEVLLIYGHYCRRKHNTLILNRWCFFEVLLCEDALCTRHVTSSTIHPRSFLVEESKNCSPRLTKSKDLLPPIFFSPNRAKLHLSFSLLLNAPHWPEANQRAPWHKPKVCQERYMQ